MPRVHLPLAPDATRRLALLKALVQVRQHTRADGSVVRAHTREQQTRAERKALVAGLARTLKDGSRVPVKGITPDDAHRTAVAVARKTRKPVHLHHARGAWSFSHRKPPGRACHAVHPHHTLAHAVGQPPRQLTHRQAREVLRATHQPPAASVPGAETTVLAHVYHHTPGSHTIAAVDPGRIRVDAGAYQHRPGANARGEVRGWEGPDAWDPAHSYQPALLHRRRDGKLFMVDGHHRLAQAHRLLKAGHALPPMNAVILHEKDGYTAEHMRAIGALANERSPEDAREARPQGPAGPDHLPAGASRPEGEQAPDRQAVGAGNTGTVYREGDEVVKQTTTLDGRPTAEGDVYDALRGVPGVAPGYRDGDTVRLPHYPQVLSTDAIPVEERARHAGVIRANAARLNGAVHALTEAGYNYADPLQAGLDAEGRLHLLDFSNAHRNAPADLTALDNAAHLQDYYRAFGLDDLAHQVGDATQAHRAMEAIAQTEHEMGDLGLSEDELAAERDLTAHAFGPHMREHHARMRRELAGAPRYSYVGTRHPGKLPLGTTHVETPAGHHVVLAAHPLDADAIARHGLLPVRHPAVTPQGEEADALALARVEALHAAEQGLPAPAPEPLRKGLGDAGRRLDRQALLDLIKALIQVKAHTRKDGTQVKAHTRNIQSKAERRELVEALARKMAAGEHTRHGSLASAVGAARYASRANGKAVHVYEHPEGGWVATHDESHTAGHAEKIVALKGRARLHRAGEASRSLAHLKGPIVAHVEKPFVPKVKPARPKKERPVKPEPEDPGVRLAREVLATARESYFEAMKATHELGAAREARGEDAPDPSEADTYYYSDAAKHFIVLPLGDVDRHGGAVPSALEAAGFRVIEEGERDALMRAQRAQQPAKELPPPPKVAEEVKALADEYEANAADLYEEAIENFKTYRKQRDAQGRGGGIGVHREFLKHAATGRVVVVSRAEHGRIEDELRRRGWIGLSGQQFDSALVKEREERARKERAQAQNTMGDHERLAITMTPDEYAKHRGVEMGSPDWGKAMGQHRAYVSKAVRLGVGVPEHVRQAFYEFTKGDRPAGAPAHEMRARLKALAEDNQVHLARIDAEIEAADRERDRLMGDQASLRQDSWDDDYRRLAERCTALRRERVEVLRAGTQAALDLLMHPENLKLTVNYVGAQGKAYAAMRETWDQGIAAFARLVGPVPGVHSLQVEVKRERGGRSSCDGNTLHMSKGAGAKNVVHELGHWLEHSDPAILAQALAFVRRRTQGEKWVSMVSLFPGHGYNRGEYTKQDRFITPYTGKLYEKTAGNRDRDEDIEASEVISMGLEHMYTDPLMFARKDPEHFDLIWNILRRTP